jgi:hypothetical protein
VSVTYAGGGAGVGTSPPSTPIYGTATGGGGSNAAGTANTGGGAGGRYNAGAGYSGGSGIVILSYPSTKTDFTSIGGGLTYTKTTSGGNTIYTFTAGTGTVTV